MGEKRLELPVRFFRIGRLYGPGMPDLGPEGMQEKVLENRLSRVGLVSVHCWNLGEEDGPYPIDGDSRCPGVAADWVPEAHGIIRERIRPVLDAARGAEMAVFHLAQSGYASKYPQYEAIAADPELREPAAPEMAGCVRPRSYREKWADQYGPGFPGPVWVTHGDNFDIASAVRPLDSEAVVVNGWQLNGLCRRMDIDMLIYVGFMADLCLVNISGAFREMSNRFGYRCAVLRDCTTAYEYEDTWERREMTRAAIRQVETDGGYSAASEDMIAALEDLR